MKVIVRHVKQKSLGTIAASSSHTMRRRPTPNADPFKPAPEVWIGSSSPADDVKAVLPEKRRKNAVLALEYVLTASPEFFATAPEAQWRSYLRDQLTMLQDYYRAPNVVSAVLHLDEKTPHLSVMIVPLVEGKLNARALVGTREACSIIQDMAGDVGSAHGLQRGQRGSKARHQDVKRFYAEIEPAAQRLAQQEQSVSAAQQQLNAERERMAAQARQLQAEANRLQVLAESLSPIEEERAARRMADLQHERDQARASIRQAAIRGMPSSPAPRHAPG